MADVLAAIVARKHGDIAARLAAIDPAAAVATQRSLRAALARPGARFVMEVKRASPSGHVARHSLEAAVTAYAPVADAISVLTDTPWTSAVAFYRACGFDEVGRDDTDTHFAMPL